VSARTVAALVAVASALALVVVVQASSLRLPGDHTGYEPDQPVLFSHQVHAGDLGVSCLYCHGGAEKSRHAGVPTAEVCMTCHRFVPAPLGALRAEEEAAAKEGREKRPVVSPEVRKVFRALALDDEGKPIAGARPAPIEWTRVHDLPDFAVFDHRPHVAAGLACQTCHGPVEAMHRVRQEASLTMGWCVSCHRTINRTGLPDGRKANASTDCSACHH